MEKRHRRESILGDLTLSGIVVDENEWRACERVVAKAAGVVRVTNVLKVMNDQELLRQYGEAE